MEVYGSQSAKDWALLRCYCSAELIWSWSVDDLGKGSRNSELCQRTGNEGSLRSSQRAARRPCQPVWSRRCVARSDCFPLSPLLPFPSLSISSSFPFLLPNTHSLSVLPPSPLLSLFPPWQFPLTLPSSLVPSFPYPPSPFIPSSLNEPSSR